jgi:O-antigen ligase
LGAAIATSLKIAVVVVGMVLAVIAVVGALTHPGRVFVALVLVVALIPTYAAPEVGSILFIPGAGLAWLIAGALAWRNAMVRGRIFRFTAIDLTVLVFAALMYISLSYSHQVEFNDFLNDLFAWGGPYLAARLLLQETRRPAFVLAASFALTTAIVAPVAVLESMGKYNPFLHLQFNSAESAVWSNAASRFGQIRAEASFGHPIALSMFVSTSAILSLGMAVYATRMKERNIWLALSAMAVVVQALTFSRTGWLILVLGVGFLAVTAALRAARRRMAVVFTAAAVGVVALMVTGNAPKELQLFPTTAAGAEGEAFQDSGAYREALLRRALEPGVLGLWGNPVNKVTPAVSATNHATDNAYIILADTWGLIPTFALIAIAFALLLAIVLARTRKAGELVVLPIVALTALFALFFVAFITQQQCMIWMLIGAASVANERSLVRRRAERARTSERPALTPT